MIFNSESIIHICQEILSQLSTLNTEGEDNKSTKKLIFPHKEPDNQPEIRISEQELRLLFIDDFRDKYDNLHYSIETPTRGKYNFGKTHEDVVDNAKNNIKGQSASVDLCIHENVANKFNRLINIEFKHTNGGLAKTSKDILKLIKEPNNGAFIHLLDSTNSGTLVNKEETGVFDKLRKSFHPLSAHWANKEKSILIIVMSLDKGDAVKMVSREIWYSDLSKLDKIFFRGAIKLKIQGIPNNNGWN